MKFSSQTLIHRFWQRVFDTPSAKAVILKRPAASASVPGTSGEPLCYVDWGGAGHAVATIMAFLRKSGFKKGDRAAILEWNYAEWVWVDLAIQSMGGVSVPIYPHSAADQVNYVLQNAGVTVVFSKDSEQLKKVKGALAVHVDALPGLLMPERYASRPDQSGSAEGGLRQFASWFVADGAAGILPETDAGWQKVIGPELSRIREGLAGKGPFLGVAPEDLSTIIYTSGSTGLPKGGCLTHGNISAACQALVAHGFHQDGAEDLHLSFLPLAHVYERVDGMAMSVWNGIPAAFCKVDEVGDALRLYRPTIMLGVPAVWRKMKDKIESKLAEARAKRAGPALLLALVLVALGGSYLAGLSLVWTVVAGLAALGLGTVLGRLPGFIVDWSLAQKEPGSGHNLADRLVFRKIRGELGGRLRLLLSGGAPISPDVIAFFDQIRLELLQGYGLTETAGGISTNRPTGTAGYKHNNRVGSVGQVVPGVEVRIVPEPGEENSAEGEIWIRGPLVFQGYWNMPEETAKCMTADGWFKTGDLGRIDADGFLYITGRKKRLLKTDGGKYVAPEKIEKAFETEAIVQYVVPVGDGKPFISGIIFLNQAIAREKLGRAVPAGIDAAAYLAEQPEIRKLVEEAVATANSKLERWETLKKFRVMPVEAKIANGLLTPTLKIRSEEVVKQFKDVVEAFYAK